MVEVELNSDTILIKKNQGRDLFKAVLHYNTNFLYFGENVSLV